MLVALKWQDAQMLKDGRVGASTLLNVALPLLAQMIIEGRAAESAGHELKAIDKDRSAMSCLLVHGPTLEVLLMSLCYAMQRWLHCQTHLLRTNSHVSLTAIMAAQL